MFDLLQKVSAALFKIKNIEIYDFVFKLHSKFTVMILLAFSILISANQYFGSTIDCIFGTKDIKSTIDTYCWILGTYINKKDYDGVVGKNILYTGIGSKPITEEDKNYQKYYQWVVFVFILQALFFYIPAYLWKIWEGGRMKSICENLGSPVIQGEWENSKMAIIRYLISDNQSMHTLYGIRYFLCEVLNFIIVVINIILVNLIFSEFWLNYAPAMNSLLFSDVKSWNSYSARIFPRMAKCDIYDVGSSGSIQKKDALCLLPLNILNEKLFAFLYFWFLFLGFLSALNIVYSLFIFSCPKYRIFLLINKTNAIKIREMRLISNNGTFGEYFMFHLMSKNLNPIFYKELLKELAIKKKAKKVKTTSGIEV